MPYKPIDYSKTIIYKIVCKDLEVTEIYVGHTTDFKTRKSSHKHYTTKENDRKYNLKIYKYIRENGGWENFDMIEIEKYSECKDSNEATARERYWYEQLNAKLNMRFPQRTDEEYRKSNKEEIKKYFDKNKDKIREQRKQYRNENKDEINNKQKERRNIPYTCSCGWIGNEQTKYRHFKNSVQHKNI